MKVLLTALFLCFFDISLHNYIFKSIIKVNRFLGQAYMITCCFPKKENSSHLSGSRFECSVNRNVILNTQLGISLSCCIFDDSSHLLKVNTDKKG